MTQPNLDQDHCMSVLAPHLERLYQCMAAAFGRYQETPAHIIAEHDERAATASVHSHIIHEITREFAEIDRTSVLDVQGLKVLNIEDKVVARFKKVDEEGRHRNHRSRQQERFDQQLPLPELPPAATHLTVGYEPDPAFYVIVRITVGCPHGFNVKPLWLAQINMIDERAVWEDITPVRLPGTEEFTRYRDDDASAG